MAEVNEEDVLVVEIVRIPSQEITRARKKWDFHVSRQQVRFITQDRC